MANIKSKTIAFADVQQKVNDLIATENTYEVNAPLLTLCDTDRYSDFGLKSLGAAIRFPAPFVREVAETNPKLANRIVYDRLTNYFTNDDAKPFFAREFLGKVSGVVSNRYAYFDDNEVMDLLSSTQLAQFRVQFCHVSPERLHIRAIDLDNPFHVKGDKSNLYMMYYIDNSMVGACAFKLRVGVFRQVCSNGLIVAAGQATMCRQIHRGNRDIGAELQKSVDFICSQQDEIKTILADATATTSSIADLRKQFDDKYAAAYLQKKLDINKKDTEQIIFLFDQYAHKFGGYTQWAFANAVTEFARDIKDVDRRCFLEANALAVQNI